jgi:ABC-type branched-subunit amino acid transport system substrate-binding protein
MRDYIVRLVVAVSLACLSYTTSIAENTKDANVGVLLPLSGALAEMGVSFRRGVELWLADHPNSKVSFLYEDHKYEGKAVVTGLHSLRGNSDIQMAIVWGNAPAGAAAPVAEQQKIPTLVISSNPDAKGRRFVASLGPPINIVVDKIVEHAHVAGIKKLGAVTIDMGNAVEVIDRVGQKHVGGVFTKVVSNEEVDFKPVINQLKSRDIDGIVLFLIPQQALTFLRQAKQMQYSPSIVGGDVFAVESFQRSAAQLTPKINFGYG